MMHMILGYIVASLFILGNFWFWMEADSDDQATAATARIIQELEKAEIPCTTVKPLWKLVSCDYLGCDVVGEFSTEKDCDEVLKFRESHTKAANDHLCTDKWRVVR